MTQFSVAVVGATGLVGTTLLSLLAEREFPIKQLHVLASEQSVGKSIEFQGKPHPIADLAKFDFSKTQVAFFCVGNDLAEVYAPTAAAAGNIVIDKSYFFRNHPDIPLIVPEVNLNALAHFGRSGIIANPNCSTIPIAVALKPIYDAVGITRINVATYQSVSGTGKEAMLELREQSKQVLADEPIYPKVYAQQIAFNVLPQIDSFQENAYTREEMKVVNEMQKIYNDSKLAINPTAVRVPVFCGHSAVVHLETKKKIEINEVLRLLSQAPGVHLSTGHDYPTPAKDAAGKDGVYVGRVRQDISHKKGINLWIVADNLRKGAALNALQIAEHLLKE